MLSADDENFILYTRLAALKPADNSDTGHFHGLGSENSNRRPSGLHRGETSHRMRPSEEETLEGKWRTEGQLRAQRVRSHHV